MATEYKLVIKFHSTDVMALILRPKSQQTTKGTEVPINFTPLLLTDHINISSLQHKKHSDTYKYLSNQLFYYFTCKHCNFLLQILIQGICVYTIKEAHKGLCTINFNILQIHLKFTDCPLHNYISNFAMKHTYIHNIGYLC